MVRPDCARVAPGGRDAITSTGGPLEPGQPYRVLMDEFLATGGDHVSVSTRGGLVTPIHLDLDIVARVFRQALSSLRPPETDRHHPDALSAALPGRAPFEQTRRFPTVALDDLDVLEVGSASFAPVRSPLTRRPEVEMRTCHRATFLGLLAFTLAPYVGVSVGVFAQDAAAVARPALTPEEMEMFLLNAKIIRTRGISTGINNTTRATLSDGRTTHDAHIQTVDIAQTLFKPARGPAELNFKDTYRYNIGAFRLARLLGLNHVPITVERRVERHMASVTWWVEDVLMDEGVRFKKGAPKEWNSSRTASQIHIMRVFDELIANQDRNAGNLLWTSGGKMWMIDHTRAFRLSAGLKNPKLLERCETNLLGALRHLTLESVTAAVGDSLVKPEIEALLKRRTAIVEWFETRIRERGERLVLYAFKEP